MRRSNNSGKSLIEQMLGFPEFDVTDFKQNEHTMAFYVETKLRPVVCPACGCYEPDAKIYKSRQQIVRDINVLGKRSAIIINRHYYRCGECSALFAEPLESVGEGERITKRMRTFLSMEAAHRSFLELESEYQISDTTIRSAFLERVNHLPPASELDTPAILGIDEICLMKDAYSRKQPWAIIANGKENTVMDVLRDRSKPSIIKFLQSMKNPQNVEIVTMDMWSGYRSAVYETLPHAMVIIDKFHIVKMATEAMDYARKYYYKNAPFGLKKSKGVFLKREHELTDKGKAHRDEWFEQYPKLKIAYDLKESFFRIYDCKERYIAEQSFNDWYKSIPQDRDYNGWRIIGTTVRRRKQEIFNYFDAPYTNAFVEGLNSVIRAISDAGRGYDFDILRGKVLLSAGRKYEVPKPNFDFENKARNLFAINRFNHTNLVRKYGVPFEDILVAIQAGDFK